MTLRRSNYKPIQGFTDWGLYTVIFFVILLPFIAIGWLKLLSISIVIGFFAGALNRFVREYYDYIYFLEEREKLSTINRVTGSRDNADHETRPEGQRDPNGKY